MSISPTKQSIPKLAPPNHTPSLLDPPSPRTHRALRRLQSAHTLGQSNHQPSLISQQHKQVLQKNHSPANSISAQHHSRARSNSDATNMTIPTPGSAGRRPAHGKKPIAADALSLDRLIREGPPDGDLVGALESVRLKILDQGIKSDTDGMVCILLFEICTADGYSPPSASTSGSSSSTPRSSKQTPTSRSSTAALPPPTPRSATTHSAP